MNADQVQLLEEIGAGGFGMVYRASLRSMPGTPLVVKALYRVGKLDQAERRALIAEARLMALAARPPHENVASFVGLIAREGGRTADGRRLSYGMVMRLYEGGSLRDLIEGVGVHAGSARVSRGKSGGLGFSRSTDSGSAGSGSGSGSGLRISRGVSGAVSSPLAKAKAALVPGDDDDDGDGDGDEDARQSMDYCQRVPLQRRLEILRDVARGLAFLHLAQPGRPERLVHRDLKPDNVLLTTPHVLATKGAISDFGLSAVRTSSSSSASSAEQAPAESLPPVASVAYRAPEVWGTSTRKRKKKHKGASSSSYYSSTPARGSGGAGASSTSTSTSTSA